jgi:flavorubredoxin
VKDLNESVETLSEKTSELLKALKQSRQEVITLSANNKKLKVKMSGLDEDFQRLKEENKVLKMASAFKGNPEAVSETKRKISQIVREIDRCIAGLND